MSTNLRKRVISDLKTTLEKEWALPVVLVNPITGVIQATKKGTTDPLVGQVNYVDVEVVPDTGEEVVVENPSVVLNLESLDAIPKAGERWLVKIPPESDPDIPVSEFESYTYDPDKGRVVNRTMGTITLFLHEAERI